MKIIKYSKSSGNLFVIVNNKWSSSINFDLFTYYRNDDNDIPYYIHWHRLLGRISR